MSDSQSRVRTNALNFRLFDHERAQLDQWAAESGTGMHAADLLRAQLFGYPIYRKPRCSDKHPTCSEHHHQLVTGYRLARHQDELDHEYLAADGEKQHFTNTGGKLITFADWLRGQNATNPHSEQDR